MIFVDFQPRDFWLQIRLALGGRGLGALSQTKNPPTFLVLGVREQTRHLEICIRAVLSISQQTRSF